MGFGEEISWGQRVFGFETPEALKEVNEQDEFNLHNLTILHGDSRGAAREGFGRFFTAHRLFYIFFIGYLLVLPALGKTLKWFRTQIQRFGIPLAPWSIGLLFLANWFYSKGLEWVLPDFDKHGLIEIKEAGMALILLLIPLYFLGVYKDTSPLDGIRPLKK